MNIERGEKFMKMLYPKNAEEMKIADADRKESTKDAAIKQARMRQSCKQAVRFSAFAMSEVKQRGCNDRGEHVRLVSNLYFVFSWA